MRDQTAAPPRFSVVVPFHNEQESVVELHRQLSEVMTGKYEPVEFIYVDDQSSDATPQLLTKIAAGRPARGGSAFEAQLRTDHGACGWF